MILKRTGDNTPKTTLKVGDFLYHQLAKSIKGHTLYARFTKSTDKLTGFYIDNGRQLKPVELSSINFKEFHADQERSEVQSKTRRTTRR